MWQGAQGCTKGHAKHWRKEIADNSGKQATKQFHTPRPSERKKEKTGKRTIRLRHKIQGSSGIAHLIRNLRALV
jgi:hypothetical protein